MSTNTALSTYNWEIFMGWCYL